MKIDYLTSNHKKAKSMSLKQSMMALFFMLFVTFAFSQETAIITTTSNDSNWSAAFQNIGGLSLEWTAVGPGGINLSGSGDTPVFDFSPNVGNGIITITITSNDNFDKVTQFLAPARDIVTVDISNIDNLLKLELPNNALTSIILTTNTSLTDLLLDNNALSAIDLSTNISLLRLEISNNDLVTLDLSANINLIEVNANNNDLTSINLLNNSNLAILDIDSNQLTTIDISNNSNLTVIDLNFNLLTTAVIGQVLNDVDAYATSGFLLKLQGNPGTIPASAINAYNNLLSRGWTIVPPVFYDFGDAPNSYTTDLTSGGPQHIIGVVDLKIGLVVDDEIDGFPSANADGDDLNQVPDDEDGVAAADLSGILTSIDNFNLDVDITNNSPGGAFLYGWIDFDGSGTFDADEYATIGTPNGGASTVTLNWTNIQTAGIVAGITYARFRISSDVIPATQPGGIVNNGEVEDYILTIELDTDGDGVGDSSDLDADNDGILNTDEVGDSNGNGIDDMLELDSDDDTCLDVTEAGFTDGDGDGILGTSPVVVDANGLITDDALGPIGDGFTTPNDLDLNGTYDFQEAGVSATITTEPTDQDLIIGVSTFSVVATADTYQWQEDKQDGNGFVDIVDGGDYAGALTADLQVTNSDVTKLLYRYQVVVSNIAFACDPTTTSVDVGYITPDDFDLDGIFDIVDVDDDNDGILDTVEENGDINRDTDGDGNLDRIDLDADGDTCFDVTEAGFTDDNGDGELGNIPLTVDAFGQVTSGSDGYTAPNDLNTSGTPDFQEAGAPANITTQPVDQIFVLAGSSTFSVVTDLVAGDESYQWEESIDNGVTWNPLADGGDYAGTNTADLIVSTPDFSKVFNRYRVIVRNIAFACDPVTTSTDATFITPGDFDKDGIFDVVDFDDDNDGILDTVEENGDVNRDTDGDGFEDRIDLDADGDGCFDVTEAGFTDDNGDGMLGDFPITVDANGQVISGSDGYTPPNDLDVSGTPDFQEAGAAATITTQPTDQDLIIGVSTFNVVATADTYQWEESQDGGATWVALADGGDYAGTTTADLQVTNSDVVKLLYRYRVIVSNIAFACDPTTLSAEARYIPPSDFDNDGVFDIVDVDDDNDGILDTVEDNGVADRDTDGNGTPDRIQLDADGDGCFDVTEAGFTDDNGDGMLGNAPVIVDVNGQVTSGSDGYTPPNDLDVSGTPDFQEAGAVANITTQPVDQNFIPGGNATFDIVATADTYQWEESTDGGATWTPIVDGGNYSGATTASLSLSNLDITMLNNTYRVLVNNIAYACDPVTTSDVAALVSLPDNDNDGVPDIVDVDDDNDGILDTVEDNGVADRDTDGDGTPDNKDLDADGDNCFDVTEAGFTDNGAGMLGTSNPPAVDASGQVTSTTDGYTAPNDLDNNGTPDFQEAGVVATITTEPVDQDFVINGSATFTVVGTGDTFQWEVSTDGINWTTLTDDGTYSGTTTASLTVTTSTINLYFDAYRVQVSNIAFACDPGIASLAATYNTLTDTDGDGVFDIVDVDDDNDGIFDTVEGEFTDSNLDGTPDRISLDADSDGCADTVEAGFDDPDGDGILGSSPVNVDAFGQVTGQGGYETPNDLNVNGVYDFQEAGSASVINNQPEEVTIALGEDAVFEVSGNATFYRWQESVDGGNNWIDLSNDDKYSGVDTDRLRITEVRGRLEGNWYRVILESPDYACDPVAELESEGVRLVFNTELIPSGFSPNGDGENDVFSIPGLIETPDFTMEVFDRWGNSVYKYANNGNLSPDWWDGRSTGSMTLSKGELVPAGTYFYLIQFNDGNKSPSKGWVYINY